MVEQEEMHLRMKGVYRIKDTEVDYFLSSVHTKTSRIYIR